MQKILMRLIISVKIFNEQNTKKAANFHRDKILDFLEIFFRLTRDEYLIV